jgi:hypothetical protein
MPNASVAGCARSHKDIEVLAELDAYGSTD